MSAWKTMESAPKDGRWVLGWEQDAEYLDAPGYIIMRFNNGAWERDGDDFSLFAEPSHWSELIAPPLPGESNVTIIARPEATK